MAAVAASTVAVVGCSSSSHKQASAGSTAHTLGTAAKPASGGTTTPASKSTLSTDQCVEVTEAQLDLATAMKTADARKAADSLEKYSPPAEVKEVVEHFVTTQGMQFDDPQASTDSKILKAWVDQVCPT
jgi:hypothetical protein